MCVCVCVCVWTVTIGSPLVLFGYFYLGLFGIYKNQLSIFCSWRSSFLLLNIGFIFTAICGYFYVASIHIRDYKKSQRFRLAAGEAEGPNNQNEIIDHPFHPYLFCFCVFYFFIFLSVCVCVFYFLCAFCMISCVLLNTLRFCVISKVLPKL